MILVLEDMDIRVQWLRKMFPATEIQWCSDVSSFQEVLRSRSPSVIILDHDLGPGSVTSEDSGGLTGYDAAKALRTNAPVLIWSVNMWGSNRMSSVLADNGVVHRALPFLSNNFPAIGAFVVHALASKARSVRSRQPTG